MARCDERPDDPGDLGRRAVPRAGAARRARRAAARRQALERHHRRAQPGPARRADRCRSAGCMRIGSLPTAAFTIAKLAWVAEHEPGLLDRVATILLPHDYLTLLADRREGDRPLRCVGHRLLRCHCTDSGSRRTWTWRRGAGLGAEAADRPRRRPTPRAPYAAARPIATRHRADGVAGRAGRRRPARRATSGSG